MARFDKKMGMVAIGAVAGGAAGYVGGTMIDKTEYASKDPDAAYKAKLAGSGAAVVGGLAALAYKKPVLGTVLLVIGGGMGAEAYTSHEAYKKATAPPSATLAPGGGAPPIVLQAPQVGGLPITFGAPAGVSPAPGALPVESVKLLPPAQSAGAVRLQSGAAARLGMTQSGAAVRLGM